jgi:predicted transcriptional regulator of viral defense system
MSRELRPTGREMSSCSADLAGQSHVRRRSTRAEDALDEFLELHPVFRTGDLDVLMYGRAPRSRRTVRRLLAQRCADGRLECVRRGYYVRSDAAAELVVAYLTTSLVAPDVILGYRTALEVHGVVPREARTVTYLTSRGPVWRTPWNGISLKRVTHPVALRRAGTELVETAMVALACANGRCAAVRVTSRERTLVDVFARPRLAGAWPAIWHTLASLNGLDLDRVAAYAIALDNATTAAKLGWFLERHQDAWHVPERVLQQLQAVRPRGPHYFSRAARSGGRYLERWNLVVPADVRISTCRGHIE